MRRKLEELLLEAVPKNKRAKVKEYGDTLKKSNDMINEIVLTLSEAVDLPSFTFFLAGVENASAGTLDKMAEEFPQMVANARAGVRGRLFPGQEEIEALAKELEEREDISE